MTEVATIAAQVSGRRVLCRISARVLGKRFRVPIRNAMQAVVDNRTAIENAATALIERERFEDDGSIVIRGEDL